MSDETGGLVVLVLAMLYVLVSAVLGGRLAYYRWRLARARRERQRLDAALRSGPNDADR